MWRVVFCWETNEAAGIARHGRLELAQLVELLYINNKASVQIRYSLKAKVGAHGK